MRDFLWEGVDKGHGSHLVSWEVVGCSINQQGLEIAILRIHNRALLARWLQRFSLETDSLWNRMIVSKHGTHPFEWPSKGVKRHTLVPRRIFPLSFSLSLGSLVVLWGMVRIHIFGRITGWGRVLFVLYFVDLYHLSSFRNRWFQIAWLVWRILVLFLWVLS